MKNWLSWIVRGSVAASIFVYGAIGDPLFDAWVAVRSFEQTTRVETEFGEVPNSDLRDDASPSDLAPSWKSRLVQQQGTGRFGRETQSDNNRAYQRDHSTTLRAFQESVGDKWKSTVQVLDKKRQVALGAIVSTDGWIVTKSSEIPDRTIEIRLWDTTKAEGTVRFRRNDLDLALIKIDRNDLPTIQWNTSVMVRVGAWLATTDIRKLPAAIGVMSVSSRNVKSERAVLGVSLGSALNGENGALVENVFDGSGADRAGVQTGDLITAIDGIALASQPEVMARLKGLLAGQRVDVGILRDGKQVLITAQMMDLNNSLLDPTEMEVNGDISARSTGFQNIIQHDSVIVPNQCGGPIVDVNGNAVGLNIARSGRVSSYAIPASVVSRAIAEMMTSVTGQKPALDENVAQVRSESPKGRTSIELPTSANGIVVESLKPEVILPNKVSRP